MTPTRAAWGRWAWARCMEAMVDPDGDVIPSEDNPYGFGGGLVWAIRGIDKLNSAGTINPDGTITGTASPRSRPCSPNSTAGAAGGGSQG